MAFYAYDAVPPESQKLRDNYELDRMVSKLKDDKWKMNPLLKDDYDELIKKANDTVEYLKKTEEDTLRKQRIEFLKWIIVTFHENQSNNPVTKSELSDLKQKIVSVVDPNSFDWKIKASIEMISVSVITWVEVDHKGVPFYYDEKWDLRMSIKYRPNIRVFNELENNLKEKGLTKEQFVDLLNSRYMQVKDLAKESTGEVKKQIGMLYDVVIDPKKYLLVYKNELKDQPWYERELEKYGLEKEIFRVYKWWVDFV